MDAIHCETKSAHANAHDSALRHQYSFFEVRHSLDADIPAGVTWIVLAQNGAASIVSAISLAVTGRRSEEDEEEEEYEKPGAGLTDADVL